MSDQTPRSDFSGQPTEVDRSGFYQSVLVDANGDEVSIVGSLRESETVENGESFVPATEDAKTVTWVRRATRWLNTTIHFGIVSPLRLVCLVTILGVLSAIPIIQLVVLGYLLEISGRLGRGGKLRESLFLLHQAGSIGLAAAAIYFWTLPIQLLTYYAYAAELIEPGNPRAYWLRAGAMATVTVAFCHLSWAWARGGRIRHYLWPQPIRLLYNVWRPQFWKDAADRLWDFLVSLQFPKLISLGFRGAICTLIWILLPAAILITAIRRGETPVAGLVGFLGFVLMGVVVMYLPMLQAQFAAENRWRSMFAIRTLRRRFKIAPIAFWLGTSATLLLAIPLYLLKIEAVPKELVWLPSVIFITFMLPAHIVTGLAMKRSKAREAGKRWWHVLIRWIVRILTIPVVATYLVFIYLSQFTSWEGLATWVQQHAFLVPVPFVGV